MRAARIAMLLLGMAAIAGVAGWWAGQARMGAVAIDDAPSESAPAPSAATPASAPVQRPSSATAPVPIARETREQIAALPLVEQLDRLGPAARAGDRDAACRLGTAVARCLVHADSIPPDMAPERLAAWLAKEPQESQDRIVDMMARVRERWDHEGRMCAGIVRETHQRASLEFLLAAARAGSTVAAEAFVAADLAAPDLLRDPALARIYADNAPALFRTLWDAGDPRAVDLLGRYAAMPRRSDRAGLHAIPAELRDAAFVRALRSVQSERLLGFARQVPNEVPISPEDRARAEREWDERFEPSPRIAAYRARQEWLRAQPPQAITPKPAEPCDEELDVR